MYFVLGIAKKAKPILDLVECFREEDEIGTIIGGGFDVHASKFDTFCIYELRFWICFDVLPRMCVMVENR